jgi:phosphatidylglycerol:prolipoprotein diacylglycerol transferase
MQMPLSSVRASEVTSVIRENLLTIDGTSWVQVHPAFLYEILWCLILLFALLILRRKKRFSGEIFMRYLAGYGFVRFFIEWIRTDQLWIPQTTIPISMVLSAVLFVFCSISVSVSRSMAKKRSEARKRRRQEIEEQKAAEREQEDDGPVDIEALLREEERLQMEDAKREAQLNAQAAGDTAEADDENPSQENPEEENPSEEPEEEFENASGEDVVSSDAGEDDESEEAAEDDETENVEDAGSAGESESAQDDENGEPSENGDAGEDDGMESEDPGSEYADSENLLEDILASDDDNELYVGENSDINVDEELEDVFVLENDVQCEEADDTEFDSEAAPDPEYPDRKTPDGGEKENPVE